MPPSPQKSERKSERCHRRRRRHSRSSSSSSSSSSDSDRSRHHRHRKVKKPCEFQEVFFKECSCLLEPKGNLGPVHVYTLDDTNYNVPVSAFLKGQNGAPDSPIDLFANCKGLGVAQNPENGINQNVYVQFNISELVADKDVVSFELCLDLLDCRGDVVEVWGSNSPSQLGKRLLKTDGEQKKVQVCTDYNFVSVTLHHRHCHEKLGFLIKCMCMYHRKPPAYAFLHTDANETIPLGSPIPFLSANLLRGFTQPDAYTIECQVKGIYGSIMTIDTLEPNACAVYVNGVRVDGSWFGANATAQDIGQSIHKLKVGDKIQLINQSSQGGTITLSPLGSGANNSVGQTTAAFSIWRVD